MVPAMVMLAEAIAANRYTAGVMEPILIFQKMSIAAMFTILRYFVKQKGQKRQNLGGKQPLGYCGKKNRKRCYLNRLCKKDGIKK